MYPETYGSWPLPIKELMPALDLALSLTKGDMAVLLLHDESIGALLPALAQGMSDDQVALIGEHRPGADPFGIAMSERRRVYVRDAWQAHDSLTPVAQSLGFRSMDIIPIIGLEGQIVGEIALMFRQERAASRRMIQLIEHCARLVVCAMQQARRRVEAERARETAEQTGRAKIQFLARMSHELRTPLQSIAGYIDLLRVGAAEPLTPSQARLLSRVHDSEEILVHVIDDLITFSRLEAGHLAYHIGPVPADEVLRITQSVIAPLATDHGVTLKVGQCAGVFVAADGDKLKQILVNLAANAVKFSDRGGTVSLTCNVDGSSVSFRVLDNGPGIDAGKLREIFEPYVQLETPLLDRYGGTGLGLAISREFASGMHGQLTVASTVGRGSEFTLRLPRATPEVAAVAAPSPRLEAPPPA
ncbi:MAG: sensor histidine kinase [Gemmatimonadaceae bacterium]